MKRIPTKASRNELLSLFALAAGMSALGGSTAVGFDIVNRWGATQLDGGNLQRGTPVTLRWSLVPDGRSYDRSANSNLIQFLDDGWGVQSSRRTPDFTLRPWFTVINNAYAQFARVSSISMVYIAEQNASGVSTGQFGDIRLGGENIDGTPGGALADNVFPDGGDMRIDTTREANGSVGSYFSTEPGLRNLVLHESGHGVGLGHAEFVNNSAHAVMEGGIRTDIWGFQFDDVYALNRQYGDPNERGLGNDLPHNATVLGTINQGANAAVGLDAVDSVVQQFDDDWVGIDGTNDTDWFRFTATGESFANIKITPVGPSYTTVQQGAFNAAAQNNLILSIFRTSPSVSLLATADLAGLGAAEQISAQYLSAPGDYLVRVMGQQDANQFYRLDVAVNGFPAPGTSADLNFDGATNAADWGLFVANGGTTGPLTPQRAAFMRGDLDLDGDTDYTDFINFKSAYTRVNGAAAFAALASVPEPSAVALAIAIVGCVGLRITRSERRFS